MKSILAGVMVLAVCGLAVAQDKKADPLGTWNCEYEISGQKRTSTLTIKKEEDKLAGTMNWPDKTMANLKDLKLQGDTLTFSAVRKFMNREFNVDYKLTIDGDKINGKGTSNNGGQKQEWDITAKRDK